jgi:hypothetical protein
MTGFGSMSASGRRQVAGRIFLGLMTSRLHQAAETCPCRAPVLRHIHDVLKLQMIQQKAIHGTVVAAREVLPETLAVQPAQPGLALEGAAHEPHLAIGREQVHDLVIQTLVEIVAIGMLQLAHRLDIVEPANLSGELLDLAGQRAQLGGSGSGHGVNS